MAIPTVPGSDIVQTPASGVKLEFGVLDAPNVARQRLAGTVGEVGQMVGGFAEKLQEAKNFGIAADANVKMQEAWAGFSDSLANRNDEEKWGEDWRARAQSVRDQIYSEHQLAPELKRKLDSNLKNWQSSTMIEANTLANKKSILRVEQRGDNAATIAAKNLDEKGINDAIDGLLANGVITPEKAEAKRTAYLNQMDVFAADQAIESNPISAWKMIDNEKNFTRLDPAQRTAFVRHAKEAMNRAQAGNADMWRSKVEDHFNNPANPLATRDELNEEVKKGNLTQRAADNILGYQTRETFKQSESNKQRLISEMLNTNFSTLEDVEAVRNRITDEKVGLVDAHYNEVTRLLDSKMKEVQGKMAKAEHPTVTRVRQDMQRDFEQGWFLPGESVMVGEYKPGVMALFGRKPVAGKETVVYKGSQVTGEKVTEPSVAATEAFWREATKAERDAATDQFHKASIEMGDWFKQHPIESFKGEADFQAAADKKRRELTRPWIEKVVQEAIAPKPAASPSAPVLFMGGMGFPPSSPAPVAQPKRNPTKEEYAALKPGDKFYWDGVETTKK